MSHLSITNLDAFSSNLMEVMRSKSSSSVKYLACDGSVTSSSPHASSVLELYILFRKCFRFIDHEDSKIQVGYAKKYIILTGLAKELISREGASDAAGVFEILMEPIKAEALIKAGGVRGTFFAIRTLNVFNLLMTTSCIQDLFFTIFAEDVLIRKKMYKYSMRLIPMIGRSFLYTRSGSTHLLDAHVFGFKPKTIVGEVLHSLLLSPPSEKAGEIGGVFYHLEKTKAFSQKPFIDHLKARFPAYAEGLDEVHAYAQILVNFLKFFHKIFHFLRFKKACLKPFMDSYFRMISNFSGYFFAPSHMVSVLNRLRNNQIDEEMTHESFSEVEIIWERDVLPFENHLQDYITRYRPQFLEGLGHVYTEFDLLKGQILKMRLDARKDQAIKDSDLVHPEIATSLQEASCYNPKIASFASAIGCLDFPSSVLSPHRWEAYIHKVQQTFNYLSGNQFFQASKKTMRQVIQSVGASSKGMPLRASGGGGGSNAISKELKETVSEDMSEEFFLAPKVLVSESLFEAIQKKPLEFNYAERVIKWFESPDECLLEPRFATKPEAIKRKIVEIHAFSAHVDLFLNSNYSHKIEGLNSKTGEDETLYRIAGSMRLLDEMKRGFFEYCIDAKGICYHRCFKELKDDQRYGDFIDNPDFDYLSQYPEISKSVPKEKKFEADLYHAFEVIQDPLGSLNFIDPKTKAPIELLKLKHF